VSRARDDSRERPSVNGHANGNGVVNGTRPSTHTARREAAHEPIEFRGLHVACIMDGNGRWATSRNMPRVAGHRAGVETVRAIVEAAPGFGIGTLTLYAFSSDNWQRPRREVAALLDLLKQYIRRETERCVRDGVRVSFIGRRDRLSDNVVRSMEQMEAATLAGRNLHLRVAVDYSSRDAILRAAARVPTGVEIERDQFLHLLADGDPAVIRPRYVDLMVRTGGEQRLSDFLLWECAYAELYFTPQLWPDFTAQDLERAVAEYHRRDRRFGRVPDAAVS
jgi:undecaprenyl diphosphate synthase